MTTTPIPVEIPLLNPNEREAQLVSLEVKEGVHVDQGAVICTLETTKSTADITAGSEGFIVGLRLKEGQTVRAGDILCYLSESPEADIAEDSSSQIDDRIREEDDPTTPIIPDGLRITRPALTLAQHHELELDILPIGPLVTEKVVRNLIQKSTRQTVFSVVKEVFDPTSMIIYGGGGHGKTLIELIHAMGVYQVIGIVDDGISKNEKILGLPVLGGNDALPEIYSNGIHLAVNAVGGVGDIYTRIQVFQRLGEAGFVCPPVLHPAAHLEPSAVLSPGVQVFSHAYVGTEAQIGFGVIVNTGTIISHGCTIGNYAHISPGAVLAGDVTIGDGVLIGMGTTINLGVEVGDGARVGNGATVKSNVPEKGIIKAGAIWPSV